MVTWLIWLANSSAPVQSKISLCIYLKDRILIISDLMAVSCHHHGFLDQVIFKPATNPRFVWVQTWKFEVELFGVSGGREERRREAALLALLALLQAGPGQDEAVGSCPALQGVQGQGEGKRKGEAERKKVKMNVFYRFILVNAICNPMRTVWRELITKSLECI